MKLYAPWEKAFKRLATPFEHFIHAQTTTGIALALMTVLALILANTSFSEAYSHFFHAKLNVCIGHWTLSYTVQHWINDGLMAIFFFIIGLEIKREVLVGELSDIKVAILPILSAIGGMAVPALIFLSINYDAESVRGWAIPMATDIAFAISVLVILHKRVPHALITFLVALAIVDDLGAVIVIAVFYTEQISLLPLGLVGVFFLILLLFNRLGIHMILPYFIISLFMWFFMLESGVHATIAGVIAAMAIPSKPKQTPIDFTNSTRNLLDEYDNYPVTTDNMMHEKQKALLINIQDRIDEIGTPSSRLKRALHLPVALVIIPLFALANAGVNIDFSSIGTTILQPISLGIISGLIFGKVIGIAGVAWLAIKIGIAKLPEESSMSQVFGVALLGGISFTMSIFIADLVFMDHNTLLIQAKIGILATSLFMGLLGFIWLRYIAKGNKSG